MTTLADLGYDQYFRRPLPQEYQLTSAVNYDALFEDGSVISNKLEDGSVDSAKIKSIRFDQIDGGTAILGGSDNKSGVLSVRDEINLEKVLIDKNGINVNNIFSVDIDGNLIATSADISGEITVGGANNKDGVLRVKNSSGVEKVTLDKDGITVKDGKITVKDDSATNVIDVKGLVSTTAFSAGSVVGSGAQSTTSTSYVDVTGLTINFTLARTQNVYMFSHVAGLWGALNTSNYAKFRLIQGSTQVGAEMITPGIQAADGTSITISNSSTSEVQQLAAGTYTLKLQFLDSNGSSSATASKPYCIVGYIILGK